MTPRLLYEVDGCQVWVGDCLDPEAASIVLQGRRVDLLHCDAPYSDKTHSGHRDGKLTADRAANFGLANGGRVTNKSGKSRPIGAVSAEMAYAARRPERSDLDYEAWSPEQVQTFGGIWLPHLDGWATTITDNVLAPAWAEAFEASGRYVFAPLSWVEIGSRVRMMGDGPSCWSCWAVVARPSTKVFAKWGTLPGAYIGPAENHQNRPERITGGKSLPMTVAFLGDYSKRGHLVLDTNLGGGTTILAARMTGRRCVGIEVNEEKAELCARLLGTKREQMGMFANA